MEKVGKLPNWRIYKSKADRNRAIAHLKKRFNYIVGWLDVQGYGLHFANVNWLKPGNSYINLVH